MLVKLLKKLKINSYVINILFKLQVFVVLKLCIKYKLINYIVNNILLIQNLTCIKRVKNMQLNGNDFTHSLYWSSARVTAIMLPTMIYLQRIHNLFPKF